MQVGDRVRVQSGDYKGKKGKIVNPPCTFGPGNLLLGVKLKNGDLIWEPEGNLKIREKRKSLTKQLEKADQQEKITTTEQLHDELGAIIKRTYLGLPVALTCKVLSPLATVTINHEITAQEIGL